VHFREGDNVMKKTAENTGRDGSFRQAVFAGGCFWCMEKPFREIPGVVEVESGYTGGREPYPAYEDVCSGITGHLEAVRILYDPGKISYDELLEVFWRQIDPTDGGGQCADRGRQYRTAIFWHDDRQRALAEESRRRLGESGRFGAPVVTEILEAGEFYRAEEYHQDFHRKCVLRYDSYRRHSGRDAFLGAHW
jgi:methionine-S-sulfoxide reductase